jgi:hypothetical protein
MLHNTLFNLVKEVNATIVPGYIYCGDQFAPTCKISASYNLAAMTSLNKTGYLPTIPVLKKDRRRAKTSLRAIAKKSGSAFGEVYDSNQILSLLKHQNIDGLAEKIDDEQEYVNTIKSQINNGNSVIAFCEIDLDGTVLKSESGYSYNGTREHAIVIVGYFEINNMPCFIYLSWGNCYTVSAKDLFDSAKNLQSPRRPELMYKYHGEWYEGHHELPWLPWVKNFTSQNLNQSTLKNYLVYSSENIIDESKSEDFIALKKEIFNAIDAYITYNSKIRFSFFNRHGEQGIINANELKRKIGFCKTLQQIRATLNYHHDFGPGNHHPHSLKTYLEPFRLDISIDEYKKALSNCIQHRKNLQASNIPSLFGSNPSKNIAYTAASKILKALDGKNVNLTHEEYTALKKGKLGRIYRRFEKINQGIKSRISLAQNTFIKDYYIIKNI